MGKCCFEFYKPKYILYILILSISQSINWIISQSLEIVFLNPMANSFLMFLGQTLSIFLYLYEKYKLNSTKNSKENSDIEIQIANKKKRNWIYFILFFCSLTELLGNFQYKFYFYGYSMKKFVHNRINASLEPIGYFFFFILIEHCFLKISIARHQILGIIINFFGIIISILHQITLVENRNYISLTLIFFIIMESQFLKTISYIIPKKLNYEYFYNMNKIIFIKGLFGLGISSLLGLIIHFFFHIMYDNQDAKEMFHILDFENSLNFKLIFCVIIYCITSCINNILILKIIEDTRPSNTLLEPPISQIFKHFIFMFITKKMKIEIKKYGNSHGSVRELAFLTLPFFLSFFGALIFCEVIVIKLFNINKNTISEISKRAFSESLYDLDEIEIGDSDEEEENEENI